MHLRKLAFASAVAVIAATPGISSASSASPPSAAPTTSTSATAPYGSFAYSGAQARHFVLPAGMTRLHTQTFPNGSTQTRYQQYVGNASVFGGQITVNRSPAGVTTSVIGAYFPGLRGKNATQLSAGRAKSLVAGRIGDRGKWTTTLRLDPRSGRYFYQVDSIRASHRPVRWVNAGNGQIIKAFDAIAEGEGIGVKGDHKTIDTTRANGVYQLVSGDDRQETYDAQNNRYQAVLMTDADDVWNYNLPKMRSPSQAPGVDAHYYANVVDDFYQNTFGRNSIDDKGMTIISVVHYAHNYCNAFWNGSYMTYGDGDGKTCLPLSGGLDVDGHELTHGVTQYTSGLIYENESGALNESFSDMMGNTMEFYAAAHGLDPAAQPDWLIGEDVVTTGGFRNMGDPMQFGDPDHYSELYTGTADNGGVHTNSGISNHAYYLMVNGGQNAGCTANQYHGVTHTADCDVIVPAAGLTTAEHVFYDGFTSLPEYANFCDARNATVAAAGDGTAAQTSTIAAWNAVGVHAGCTPGTPPPPPCTSDPDASIPFESPHPYGNNADCTWTYNNGSAGFAFHFSLLDTEKDYDYVYVKDAAGNVLATYTGTYKRAVTSPCIPTSSGSVQLVSDSGVTAQGFTVDAVEPC